MNIKDNIDKEVLDAVAKDQGITGDLLISVISSDLNNNTVLLLSFTFGLIILAVFLAFIAYFQFKKSEGDDEHEFFGNFAAVACLIVLIVSFFMFLINSAYMKQIEVVFNHDYAVVKEINEMHKAILNREAN